MYQYNTRLNTKIDEVNVLMVMGIGYISILVYTIFSWINDIWQYVCKVQIISFYILRPF